MCALSVRWMVRELSAHGVTDHVLDMFDVTRQTMSFDGTHHPPDVDNVGVDMLVQLITRDIHWTYS